MEKTMKLPDPSHTKRLLPFLVVIILFSSTLTMRVTAFPQTTICVDPLKVIAKPGEVFSVDINISDVTNLYAYGLKLGFEPYMNIISVFNVSEGDFLKNGGDTIFAKKIDNFRGYVDVGCTLLGSIPGVDGNGTLVTIKFTVHDIGDSILDLYDTNLLDSNMNTIDHEPEDGYFSTPAIADLIRRGAWPKNHRFSISKSRDGIQTLYGKLRNLGDESCYVRVKFEVTDELGEQIGTFLAKYTFDGVEVKLAPGETVTLYVHLWEIREEAWIPARYYIESICLCSAGQVVWGSGDKMKTFSFIIVP